MAQTVSLPWRVWQRAFAGGEITGMHHMLVRDVRARLAPFRVVVHVRELDWLGLWAVTPLSGHYLPVGNATACDTRSLSGLVGDEGVTRILVAAWASFPTLSNEERHANQFWMAAQRDAQARLRSDDTHHR